MVSWQERIAGGLYGLLVGDALGVSYEFYEAWELPAYEEIEMVPPPGFRKTYPKVDAGTWSDDGAQALCLMDSLLKHGKFSLKAYSDALLAWYEEGFWAVDGVVFDVGIQTANALDAYKRGIAVEACGLMNPDGKGNGALMRVLPLALWHFVQGNTDLEKRSKALVRDAHSQCLITHGHLCNQVCSALYCLVAQALLEGMEIQEAIQEGVFVLRSIYREEPAYEQELEWSVRPDIPWEGKGTGYVVDCLRSALMILEQALDYEDAVKRAVLLGHDTDTTACVTGGLAGIYYGLQGIPRRWIQALKEREKVEYLLKELKKDNLK
ncbi:MAG: ADP-ribosylglycohydrolase family protein [Lachnospiraceae bacterium]|nr:ADP-ribosylglycohydrolase family protein [Lachnospiraceae bacterium]